MACDLNFRVSTLRTTTRSSIMGASVCAWTVYAEPAEGPPGRTPPAGEGLTYIGYAQGPHVRCEKNFLFKKKYIHRLMWKVCLKWTSLLLFITVQ